MKETKPKVEVQILEHAGDNDRYLIRYKVPKEGLVAVEWVSLSGARQWVRTAKKSTLMYHIMNEIKKTIEEWQKKEAKKNGETDSD